MLENLVPMVIMTGMFAMIFGIVYIRSRENMAMIEKGVNPRQKDTSPRPFVNLKWGLLGIGSGLGLLLAFMIDHTMIDHKKLDEQGSITIGGHHSGKGKMIGVTVTPPAGKDTALSAVDSTMKNALADIPDEEDEHSVTEIKGVHSGTSAIYFALIAIGGGIGLVVSYTIEKKHWLDKNKIA